jgi:hypothetical protein
VGTTVVRRRRVGGVLAAVALLTGLVATGGPSRAASAKQNLRWIVTLVPGSAMANAVADAESLGGRVGVRFDHVLLGFTLTGSRTAAEALASNPNVQRIFPDGPVRLAQTAPSTDVVPTGVSRVDAPAAHTAGLAGAGATVAIIDSGIDLTHPDLIANLHPTLGKNCLDPPQDAAPPQDANGHGTHVAGIVAAAANGFGVVGVAPGATLVPVQSFDALGNAHWSNVICGIDYVAAHADVIDVANMSFGDLSTSPSSCGDGPPTDDFDALHEAVCGARAAGVVLVAAAGNNGIDAQGFVPAAYPEVITVSALSDLDGTAGGAAGCIVFGAICDDGFASLFSNYGAAVDVMAPGFEILSTVPGGYGIKDGTSMAAPHVTGTVALMLAADPDLTHDEVAYMLRRNGECPDGTPGGADGGCGGQGSWALDPDGTSEPLVDAARSALAATVDEAPEVTLTSGPGGQTVSGSRTLTATATDDRGVANVAFAVDGAVVATDANGADGWSGTWATAAGADGAHAVTAVFCDTGGQSATSAAATVRVLNHLHVGDLTAVATKTRSTWSATATVTAHDGAHAAVAGAVAVVRWTTDSGGTSGQVSCTTAVGGTCSVSSGTLTRLANVVTFTVLSLDVAGGAADRAADHDPAPVGAVTASP